MGETDMLRTLREKRRFLFGKSYPVIIQQALGKEEKSYFKNVYITLEGTLAPMPFNTGKEGLWKFDGQFWWLEHAIGDKENGN